MQKKSNSFITGAIALVFAVLGYQTALLVHYSATTAIIAHRDHPDTVYIYTDARQEGMTWTNAQQEGMTGTNAQQEGESDAPRPDGADGAPLPDGADGAPRHYSASPGRTSSTSGCCSSRRQSATRRLSPPDNLSTLASEGGHWPSTGPRRRSYTEHPGYTEHQRLTERHNAPHHPVAQQIRAAAPRPAVESFPFDPNTVSIEDLTRLGFSLKQAQSIDAYRAKGGRFRKAEDFARSYVVSDSVFTRLRPYIRIPKLDINAADSAAFDALPGIGGTFARRMVEYRWALGGYSFPEQLLDIRNFDAERYDGLKDLISVSPPPAFRIWTLPEDSLSRHPYIGRSAHGIVLFRENSPREKWTIKNLADAGIIPADQASKLERCRLEGCD